MPYQLMSDEHMRARVAAGEAERLATTPNQIVQYDGARWTRSGDMWIRDDRKQPRRFRSLGIRGLRSGDAESSPADEGQDAASNGRPGIGGLIFRDLATIDAAEEADGEAAGEPVQGETGIGPGPDRRHRRRYLVAGTACLVLASGVVLIVVGGDLHRRDAAAPVADALPSPSAEAGTGIAGPSDSPDPVPAATQPPLSPAASATESKPTRPPVATPIGAAPPVADPGQERPPQPPPEPTPGDDRDDAPPEPPAKPDRPEPEPANPNAAAAELESTLVQVDAAGQLSRSGRQTLQRRVGKIREAVARDQEKRVSREIGRMRQEIDSLNERGGISDQGALALSASLGRLEQTL